MLKITVEIENKTHIFRWDEETWYYFYFKQSNIYILKDGSLLPTFTYP